MTPDVIAALAAVLAGTSGAGGCWFWYDKKKSDKKLEYLEAKMNLISLQQAEHENKFVTEQRTREIFREEFKPIKEDTTETKHDVKRMMELLIALQTDIKVMNAVEQAKKEFSSRIEIGKQ